MLWSRITSLEIENYTHKTITSRPTERCISRAHEVYVWGISSNRQSCNRGLITHEAMPAFSRLRICVAVAARFENFWPSRIKRTALFGFGVIFLSASSLDFVRVKLLREKQVTKLGGSGGVGGGGAGLYVRPECPVSWISVPWLSKVTRGDNMNVECSIIIA